MQEQDVHNEFGACLLLAGLNAILLIDVDIPPYIEEGSNATLSCLFEVEYDGLYR